jgi:hypothetical protein
VLTLLLRPGNLPGVAGAGRRGASSEAETLAYAEGHTTMGISETERMTAVTAPFHPRSVS